MSTCVSCGYGLGPDDAFCAGCGSAQPGPATQASPGWDSRAGVAGVGGASAVPAWARSTIATAPTAPAPTAPTALGQAPDGAGAGREQQDETNAAQEAYFANTRDTASAGAATLSRTAETTEQKYMRHTRNACVFIAVIVGVFTALLLIGTIWGVVQINTLHNELNNGVNNLGNSNCSSEGGTNPSC